LIASKHVVFLKIKLFLRITKSLAKPNYEGIMMDSEKSTATAVMWLSYLAMIWFSFTPLGIWAILLAFVLMMPLMGAMAFMWTTKAGERREPMIKVESGETEKRKRERLDSVLRDLSDDELMRLKERLMDGTVDDGVLYDRIVGEDGELQYKRTKR
jgi:hypothetical protein